MEDARGAFNSLTDKSTGKRPLGRPWHRWEDSRIMQARVIEIHQVFEKKKSDTFLTEQYI